MRILINLSTLKKGGGQNVGLNFIDTLFEHYENIAHEFVFIVAKDSGLHKYLINKKNVIFYVFPNNPILRIIKEVVKGKSILREHRIDIVYTYFGVDLFGGKIKRVMGSADSNLFFPEIDFWKEYSGIAKFKRVLVDKFRIWGLKRATAVIFENGLMETEGKRLFNLTETKLVKPSVKKFVAEKLDITFDFPGNSVGLFLCGWQRNKNFMLIPQISNILKNKGIDYHFVITAPANNSEDHINFMNLLEEYGVEDTVSIIGQVEKSKLPSLFSCIDHIFLLSKLESFSNNIIEAWFYKKVLIVSDAKWSRYLCSDAACYVDRDSPDKIADVVMELVSNPKFGNEIVNNGNKHILTYPTIKERTFQEIEYLEYVNEQY